MQKSLSTSSKNIVNEHIEGKDSCRALHSEMEQSRMFPQLLASLCIMFTSGLGYLLGADTWAWIERKRQLVNLTHLSLLTHTFSLPVAEYSKLYQGLCLHNVTVG